MKRIVYIIAALLLLGTVLQSVSLNAFSLRRKKQAVPVAVACDTGAHGERYTDTATFRARIYESLQRLRDNLGATSSARNSEKLRHYFSRQTLDLFDTTADSVRPVKVCSAYGDTVLARSMAAVDFLAYLEKQTDSMPHILELQVPVFAKGGFDISTFSECSSIKMREADGNFVAGDKGDLVLRCYWEPTVYGYQPSPRFGGMVVEMLPLRAESMKLKTDTIDGRVLPVYIPAL